MRFEELTLVVSLKYYQPGMGSRAEKLPNEHNLCSQRIL